MRSIKSCPACGSSTLAMKFLSNENAMCIFCLGEKCSEYISMSCDKLNGFSGNQYEKGYVDYKKLNPLFDAWEFHASRPLSNPQKSHALVASRPDRLAIHKMAG